MAKLGFETLESVKEYVALNKDQLAKVVEQEFKTLRPPRLSKFWVSPFLLKGALALWTLGLVLLAVSRLYLTINRRQLEAADVGEALLIAGGAVAGAGLVAIAICLLLSWIYRKSVKFDAVNVYQSFFANRFDNLQVTSTFSLAEAEKIVPRPYGVSSRVKPLNLQPGVQGVFNGLPFRAYWVSWQPASGRGFSIASNPLKGKAVKVMGVAFTNLDARFNGLDATLRYPMRDLLRTPTRKPAGVAEGANEFDKQVVYSTNNPDALRAVITPELQGIILERLKSNFPSTEVTIRNNTLHIMQREDHDRFGVAVPRGHDRAKALAKYTNNLADEVARFIAFISHADDYAALMKS